MIGKLDYVVHSRLDIAHVVGLVARFQKSPKETHMVAVKRISRYLKGTIVYGLWYPYRGNFSLKVFTDTDWARNVDYQKSINSGDFLLGGRLVSWTSKRKNCVSQSTIEAEYVIASMNCKQFICMSHVLEGFKQNMTELVIIYCENTSAINIFKNPMLHARTNILS